MTLDPKHISSEKFTFTNDDLTDNASIYTLEDELSDTHLNTPSPASQQLQQENPGSYEVYDLPTHISSHHDVLADDYARTQPSTPVSTPYQERPNHPLRALTSTHLVLNQQNGTDDSLVSLDGTPRGAGGVYSPTALRIEDDNEEDWDKRGAAQLIKRETDKLTGETDEIIIRKSVKDFKFGKTLGVGSYSTVLLATDKNSGRNFAVKVLDKRHIIREKKVKYVNIEKNTLNRLGKRDGIIHLFFTFQDESSLYFVLDYASNGELLNLIKQYGSLNEETTKYYGAQILDAVKYMHDNGVVHRDLKPENILLDERKRIQITDFGTAKLLEKNDAGRYPSDTRAKSFVGTAEYVSPELLNEKAIGKACDIWALGCILYQMIAGKPPFKATNEYLTFQKIVKLQFAFTAGFPMGCRDLIKKILVLNPKDRITIKEIQQHYFFQPIDFSNPEESVWLPDPPEIGPYKVSAKSMLPIPELNSNASQSRLKITIPPKRNASSSTSIPTTGSNSTSSADVEATTPNESIPTQSQQILMRAKAGVAARKQQEANKRITSSGNAANAASIALSRQPNEIIKAYNEKQDKDKKVKQELERIRNGQPEELKTPPLSASSNFKESPQSGGHAPKPRSASSHITTLRERKKPPAATSAATPSPMTKLDLEFLNHLKNVDERVLKKGELNTYITSVDAIERKYRGRLVDSPLGGNKSTTSSLLSQVANGSVSGLRNMDSNDNNTESSVVINYDKEDDENKNESAKTKFRKFFTGGGSTEDHKRSRTLVSTSGGRALIFNKNEKKNDTLEIKTEIDLTNPVIKIKELLPPAVKSANTGGLFVIQSFNTAFVFESSQAEVSQWTQVLFKARTLFNEKYAQKLIEQDPSGDAGTVLGSDAAKSAANLATISSPPLSAESRKSTELKSPVMLTSPTFDNNSNGGDGSLKHKEALPRVSQSSGSSGGGVKHEGMLKNLVRARTSQRNSSKKELPNNGQLHYGLPVTGGSPTTNTTSSPTAPQVIDQQPPTQKKSNTSSSKNPLIAAAEAAISKQRSKDENTKRQSTGSSSSQGDTSNASPQNVPRLITGMNSRLLARTHDRRKK